MNIKSKTKKLLFTLALYFSSCTHSSTKKIPQLKLKAVVSESGPLLSCIDKESPRKNALASPTKTKPEEGTSISELTPKKQPLNAKTYITKTLSIDDIKTRYWLAQIEILQTKIKNRQTKKEAILLTAKQEYFVVFYRLKNEQKLTDINIKFK